MRVLLAVKFYIFLAFKCMIPQDLPVEKNFAFLYNRISKSKQRNDHQGGTKKKHIR